MISAVATTTQRDDQRIRLPTGFRAEDYEHLTPRMPYHTHYDVPTIIRAVDRLLMVT